MSDVKETPLEDHISYAIQRMEQGARMILDAIPNDSSLSSASFGPTVTAEIARRLRRPLPSSGAREALEEAQKAMKLLEDLTACGADDDYVSGVQKKIADALAGIHSSGDLDVRKAEIIAALDGMLKHSCVADTAGEDKDEEDHAAERRARSVLASLQPATINTSDHALSLEDLLQIARACDYPAEWGEKIERAADEIAALRKELRATQDKLAMLGPGRIVPPHGSGP